MTTDACAVGATGYHQNDFKDLSVQKQAAAKLLGFNEEKWDHDDSDDESDDDY